MRSTRAVGPGRCALVVRRTPTIPVKRTRAILLAVGVTIVIAVGFAAFGGTKTTVYFSLPQTDRTTNPTLKVTFAVTNTANQEVHLFLLAVERQSGSPWIHDWRACPHSDTLRMLGKVGANATGEISAELPDEPAPTRLRVVVQPGATAVQKARHAMRTLWARVRGQRQYQQFWFQNLAAPSYEIITPEIR